METAKYTMKIQPSEQLPRELAEMTNTTETSRVQNTRASIEQKAGIENSSPATLQYRFQNVRWGISSSNKLQTNNYSDSENSTSRQQLSWCCKYIIAENKASLQRKLVQANNESAITSPVIQNQRWKTFFILVVSKFPLVRMRMVVRKKE